MKFTEEQMKLIDNVISEQLRITETEEFTQRDGEWRTTLTPVTVQSLPETNIIDLSGEWSFLKLPVQVPEENLAAPGRNVKSWDKIEQPGKAQCMDPEVQPASIPEWDRIKTLHFTEEDGCMLRRDIDIPAEWKGKEIFINFDAIYPAGRIYVNGKLVANHESGLTPVCRNITEFVKPGRSAVIAVRIRRRHAHIMMDMPRHSVDYAGIAQKGFIFAKEACHIDDYYLPSFLNSTLTKGNVEGNVKISNTGKKAKEGTVYISVYAPDGTLAADKGFDFRSAPGSTVYVPACLEVKNPRLWNDEHPDLYSILVRLSVRGQDDEYYSFKTGFRRFEFRDGHPFLNNHPVKFRGVNHLSGHPQHGLYTPEDWLRKNLELMKLANVNCIRTHYMGPRPLVDLCDEMGIYLMQELPVDWGTHYIHDPDYVGPALMRLQGGVCRDRNHPSIMVWSIGNENMPESDEAAPNGWMHLRMYEKFVKTLDPKGITMFPPPGPASKIDGIFELRVGDVADIHYSFVPVKRFLKDGKVENPYSWEATMEVNTKEEALERGWTGSWFSSEYCAISCFPDIIFSPNECSIIDDEGKHYPEDTPQIKVFYDRLKREWGFLRNEVTCLGGAYFPWMSAGSSASLGHPFSWTILSEDCDWGVMTPELIPKPNFWVLRNLFCPVWFPDRVEVFKDEETCTFELWNQYNDINLSECTLRFGWPNSTCNWTDVKINLAPGEKKLISFPMLDSGMSRSIHRGESCIVRLWLIDPKGFVSTVKDIEFYSGNRERTSSGSTFDVSPEPAYIDKKKQ